VLLCYPQRKKMLMSYTEIYRKIYAQVKSEKISHEDAHKISLSITEAISNLGLIIKENPINVALAVKNIIKEVVKDNI